MQIGDRLQHLLSRVPGVVLREGAVFLDPVVQLTLAELQDERDLVSLFVHVEQSADVGMVNLKADIHLLLQSLELKVLELALEKSLDGDPLPCASVLAQDHAPRAARAQHLRPHREVAANLGAAHDAAAMSEHDDERVEVRQHGSWLPLGECRLNSRDGLLRGSQVVGDPLQERREEGPDSTHGCCDAGATALGGLQPIRA
mmetsp:Transcript_155441/g.498717  ORF Transcript_155441/g.498717 Transcript_155441/m.498717 type:complete len:201 (-) Transcript_155441:12-614(-)